MNVTAAILIIGNEILSGRTQDINTAWLANELTLRGISVKEARVVSDDEPAIIAAVNELRAGYDYLFTTGGIGPTHDDLTSAAIAAGFGLPLREHPEARRRLEVYYAGKELNTARLKMAQIPESAELIDNPVSAAPGFRIKNVFVMAGIPAIMQAMFASFADDLEHGIPIQSLSLTVSTGEGDIAAPLAALQQKYPDVDIGSYPSGDEDGFHSVTIVVRHMDSDYLGIVQAELKAKICAERVSSD